MTTRVLLVDDHPIVQRGLRVTLDAEPDLRVVAVAGSGEAALAALDAAAPDVALVDVSLPGMNGVELVRHLLARRPALRVLVVSRHDAELYAERAVRAGARGFLSKLEAAERVVDAVRAVRDGRLYLDDATKDRLVLGAPLSEPDPLAQLSDRELQVYEALGHGCSTREIADALALSVKTVETYRTRVRDKLGLGSSRALLQHATRWAADHGADGAPER